MLQANGGTRPDKRDAAEASLLVTVERERDVGHETACRKPRRGTWTPLDCRKAP